MRSSLKNKIRQWILIALITLLFIIINGCYSNYQSSVIIPDADMTSSLEELINKSDEKSPIVKELDNKISNFELFNVVDFTKKYVFGVDMGCAIFYDLKKENESGSGNIFLYIRNNTAIESGLSQNAKIELQIERQYIEKKNTENFEPNIKDIDGMEFFETIFVTPPDIENNEYDCYLYTTGFNNVYLKIIFYYPVEANYGQSETSLFMKELANKLKSLKPKM